jgi:hypothetical protein
MNSPSSIREQGRFAAAVLGVLGALLIIGVLVWALRHYTQPPPVGAKRAAERYENLKQQRAADAKDLNEYAWQNKDNGIVRLPVARAVELTLREYQNPGAARSNLHSRLDKATAKPPERPNAFD